MADASAGQLPLRVAVLVDLERRPDSGGHVKCWERLAQAATAMPDLLDLTVFFSGRTEEDIRLADNVRFRILPPAFSTRRIAFLGEVPDHTDLAPHHRRLAALLKGFDVLHTTDGFFAFARTAARVAKRSGTPLVNSLHTDTLRYTRIYTARTIERWVGRGRLYRWLVEALDLPGFAERRQQARLHRHQRQAAVVLGLPDAADHPLRRGVDRRFFTPQRADRDWLESRFAIPPGRFVVLFAGRLDVGKNVMVLAEAVAGLVAEGLPVHLLCAGEGPRRTTIESRLDGFASCPGVLDADELGRVYASADVFALPSRVEVHSNVVMESLACGTPVLVTAASGMDRVVVDGETGLVVATDGAAPWCEALRGLQADPGRCRAMRQGAVAWAARHIPTWEDVLRDDLLPVWLHVAGDDRP